jgi:hypothetical protein
MTPKRRSLTSAGMLALKILLTGGLVVWLVALSDVQQILTPL